MRMKGDKEKEVRKAKIKNKVKTRKIEGRKQKWQRKKEKKENDISEKWGEKKTDI